MEKIVLASANKHKIEEFNAILGGNFKILSLEDVGFNREIEDVIEKVYTRDLFFRD